MTGGFPWGVCRVGGIKRRFFSVLFGLRIKHSNVVFEEEHRRHAVPPPVKRSGHVCVKVGAAQLLVLVQVP